MAPDYRIVGADETDAAARIHRAAAALIPGYDINLHSLEEGRAFYRGTVYPAGPIWGAFEDRELLGFAALVPGWIEHLYVGPSHHGRGIGSRLIDIAQREQDDLQLWTFQSNAHARAFYERRGFAVEELTDGHRNEERMPDVRYRWRREIVVEQA